MKFVQRLRDFHGAFMASVVRDSEGEGQAISNYLNRGNVPTVRDLIAGEIGGLVS